MLCRMTDTTAKRNATAKQPWFWLAQRVRDIVMIEGHGPGSEIAFMDFIPGPRLMEAFPPDPFPEGEKLRARFVEKNPEMDAILVKRRAGETGSVPTVGGASGDRGARGDVAGEQPEAGRESGADPV